MEAKKDVLTLKWGTLKNWNFNSEECRALIKEYQEIGYHIIGIIHQDTPRQKEIICELIDKCNCDTILLEWDDIKVSKRDAKEYVINYPHPSKVRP